MTSVMPRVQPDDLDLAFYQAVAEAGHLCLQNCDDCDTWTHPARYFCPNCSSPNFTFRAISGRAEIHSYTVSHFSVEKAWKDRLPSVTIVAETEEGPRLLARTDMAPDAVQIGDAIELRAEVMGPEFSYVWADPAGGAA